MNMICTAIKFPAITVSPELHDTLEMVRKMAIAALLSALESRLGFPVVPWLDGVDRVWLNRIIAVAKAFPRRFI